MKYYCIKQHDITDCGAACLATISKTFGKDISISKIREVAGTDKQGTNVFGLVKASEKLGFSAKGVKGDKNLFLTEKFPLPAIAHVVKDGNLLHYIVVYKITKKYILVSDPADGIKKYSHEEFFAMWTGILVLLTPMPEFNKTKEKKKNTLSRFFALLKPQTGLLINIFLYSLIITAFGILASFYFRFIMDDVATYGIKKTLVIISIGVLALYLFKGILEYFRNQLTLYLSQKLDIPLILGYYKHVLGLPMKFFSSRKTGEIISRFMDASKIRDAISGATLTIMIDTIMAVVGGIILFFQNKILFAISVFVLIFYAIIVFCYNKPIKKINEKVMEQNAEVTSYLVESVNGIETVKSFNGERKSQYETEKKFVKFLKSIFHNGKLSNGQQTLTATLGAIGEVVILWVGTTFVLNGNLTIGGLITFNALLGYFLTPVKNLINLQPTMQTAIVAADRLAEILDLDLEKDENEDKRLKNIELNLPIKVSNLEFHYGERQSVLKNINMEIAPYSKIAIVGESGSGKTTFVKLLMKLYKIENGQILYGNYNINDINTESLRDKISYVSQDTFLFSGTIKENLEWGNPDASYEDIISACELSKANEFIDKLPMRYETPLDEKGLNLSGGQRQRLAIARALIKKPNILIFDEATSNLDSVTEKAIEKTIDGLSNKMTVIIIAHRLSTIMRCDNIFVFSNGEIVESGNHKNLMQKKGCYFELWKEQIPDYIGEKNCEN